MVSSLNTSLKDSSEEPNEESLLKLICSLSQKQQQRVRTSTISEGTSIDKNALPTVFKVRGSQWLIRLWLGI